MDVWGLQSGWDGLRMELGVRRQNARKAAASWGPGQLATSEADVVDYLVAQYSVECPALHPERTTYLPASGVSDGIVTIAIAVPFDGEGKILNLCLSRPFRRPLAAQAEEGELRLEWTVAARANDDPAAVQAKVRRYFDRELGTAGKYLSLCRSDIDRHNAMLRKQVSSIISRHRARAMADRRLEASLGYPVPQRETPQFAVPVTRRKIETLPRPAPSRPSQPEWVLPEAQYEQAVAVLRNARNTLERHPSMTTHLEEERIRDLLLAFLNAQFEGAAAGEVFNAAGKTDILIRAGDRNVFIAECKIWDGPAKLRAALEQLLNYLTWRDTKTALLVFIRHGEPPTQVIAKAIEEIERHPNYKRTSGTGEEGERYDFILHATGDPDREIRLAFLPFAMQDKGTRRSRRRASTSTTSHGPGTADS